VDATEQKKFAGRYNINSYPILKFFLNKTPIEYNGGRQEADLVAWGKKKAGDSSEEVTSHEELAKKMVDNKLLMVYYG
jgi:protein disulfide-isomerase A1